MEAAIEFPIFMLWGIALGAIAIKILFAMESGYPRNLVVKAFPTT